MKKKCQKLQKRYANAADKNNDEFGALASHVSADDDTLIDSNQK